MNLGLWGACVLGSVISAAVWHFSELANKQKTKTKPKKQVFPFLCSYFYLSLSFYFILVCVHVHVCSCGLECVHAMACVWRAEDNLGGPFVV